MHNSKKYKFLVHLTQPTTTLKRQTATQTGGEKAQKRGLLTQPIMIQIRPLFHT